MILNLVLPTNRRIRIFAVDYLSDIVSSVIRPENRPKPRFFNENVSLRRNQLANSVIYFQKQDWQFCLSRLVFFSSVLKFRIGFCIIFSLKISNTSCAM